MLGTSDSFGFVALIQAQADNTGYTDFVAIFPFVCLHEGSLALIPCPYFKRFSPEKGANSEKSLPFMLSSPFTDPPFAGKMA